MSANTKMNLICPQQQHTTNVNQPHQGEREGVLKHEW